MKIAHIFKTYFPDTQGGVEEAIRQITRFTSSQGIENRVITLSKHPQPACLHFPEAKIVRYKTHLDMLSTPMSIAFFRNYPQAVKDCDILHFHFPWPFAELIHLIRPVTKPAIVTYHADARKYRWLQLLYSPFMNRFLSKMDRIVVTSRQYLDSSVDLIPFHKKCHVIPLTLDPGRFGVLNPSTLAAVQRKFGNDFFLFIGVLRAYKGITYLLEAMRGVHNRLVIIGKGKEKTALEKQCRELGLKNVQFAGYVDDCCLPAFYQLCKAFVFPSINRSEAFGVSLLEASYFAKPMITTQLFTGTSYVNRHGVTGLVVPPKNPAALRNAMNTLSANDVLCQRYGENALRRLNALFTPNLSGRLYMDMYREISER